MLTRPWFLNACSQSFLIAALWECRVFLVLKCTCITKVSYFFRSLLLTAVANPMFCVFFCKGCRYLCGFAMCAAVCGMQFLSRVDILMQFYGVFWEPLMGMSCFFVETWLRIIKVSCFSVHVCSQLSPISCFVCIVCIFCWYLCDSVLVRCSLWQQFLSRVDILMQFSDVFWEPFMGMSCVFPVSADKCVMF